MSTREIFAAVSRTRSMNGRSVRVVAAPLLIILLATVAWLSEMVMWPAFLEPHATMIAFGVLALGLLILLRRLMASIRTHNNALSLFHAGKYDDAGEVFARLVHCFHGRMIATTALHNLGEIALRQGRFDDAVTFARAQIALVPNEASMHRAEQHVAFALACAGRVDESEAALSRVPTSGVDAHVLAGAVITRALCHFRAGRFEQALTTLRSDRALVRNLLNGWSAALVEAIERGSHGSVGRIAAARQRDRDCRTVPPCEQSSRR